MDEVFITEGIGRITFEDDLLNIIVLEIDEKFLTTLKNDPNIIRIEEARTGRLLNVG